MKKLIRWLYQWVPPVALVVCVAMVVIVNVYAILAGVWQVPVIFLGACLLSALIVIGLQRVKEWADL